MILDYNQINSALDTLRSVREKQESITKDTERVIVAELSSAWSSKAQVAYQDAFCVVRDRLLKQINSLISLFEIAATQSHEGLYQVDIDLANMNSHAMMD